MCRVGNKKKLVLQAGFVVILFLLMLYTAMSQQISLGQSYQQVILNGKEICCVSLGTDAESILRQERRILALQSEEPVSMMYEFSVAEADRWFVPLVTEEELADILKEELKSLVIPAEKEGYTVAIEGYRANFSSLDELGNFFEQVKQETDPQKIFVPGISREKGHIAGILTAELVENNTDREREVLPQETLADRITAGADSDMLHQLSYALANPKDDSYKTGLLAMEFMENIEIYGHKIAKEELSDVAEEVAEVTKEKETNKIYVVESGDCLSVIALDHDTTVASIIALNGFESAEKTIRPGDELIIAVPEPDLSLRIQKGEVYEEDYRADPVIIENDSWYTTTQVVHEEGTVGHRERNDIVTYENGIEVEREMIHQNIMVESIPAVIERGTITPPTYIKPLSGGRKTSNFGRRWGRLHKGVDYACPVGTIIFASSAGTVISAGYNNGYGYNVLISHPDGKMTRYAHCSKLQVSVGQHVEQGETIALSGNTGRSTGPHLHFEIYVDGVAVNPLNYIGN